MSDTKKMPASGEGRDKGQADGVSDSPDAGAGVHGRTAGGESGGGGYPSPHGGEPAGDSGFIGHGGQSEIGYHGGGQAGEQGGDAPNAGTGSSGSAGTEAGAAPAPEPEHETRQVHAGGQSFAVIEDSGIAAAEARGQIGIDTADDAAKDSAGSG